MKKIYFLAALAATMLVGCMDDGNRIIDPKFPEGDPSASRTELTIRLSYGGSLVTRALEGRGDTTPGTNQIENAHVFILDEENNVTDYARVYEEKDLTALKGSGWVFPESIPRDSRVYILGNVHTDYNRTVRDLETLTAINSFTSDIWTQVDYNYSTMANEEFVPVEMSLSSSGSASVLVRVTPVISRLELHSLVGQGNINGFSVTGVFISEYYAAYTYGGGFPEGAVPINNKVDLASNGGMTGDELLYPTIAQRHPTTSELKAEMTGNRIWAYNVTARSLPHLVVRLENVLIGATLVKGPLYLTVSGYGGVTGFKAGIIYRIGELEFTEEHLTVAPTAGGINVEPNEWDDTDLNPDLDTPGASIALTMPNTYLDWEATDSGTDTQDFAFTAPASLTNFTVELNQGPVAYFTQSAIAGNAFTVAPAAVNTSVFPRTATVRIIGDDGSGTTGYSNQISILQKPAAIDMAGTTLAPTTLSFNAADDSSVGAAGNITFESNVAFYVDIIGPNADMFSLSGTTSATTPDQMTSYTINVVPVAENLSGAAYSATVVIRSSDANYSATEKSITVTQSN